MSYTQAVLEQSCEEPGTKADPEALGIQHQVADLFQVFVDHAGMVI